MTVIKIIRSVETEEVVLKAPEIGAEVVRAAPLLILLPVVVVLAAAAAAVVVVAVAVAAAEAAAAAIRTTVKPKLGKGKD